MRARDIEAFERARENLVLSWQGPTDGDLLTTACAWMFHCQDHGLPFIVAGESDEDGASWVRASFDHIKRLSAREQIRLNKALKPVLRRAGTWRVTQHGLSALAVPMAKVDEVVGILLETARALTDPDIQRQEIIGLKHEFQAVTKTAINQAKLARVLFHDIGKNKNQYGSGESQ